MTGADRGVGLEAIGGGGTEELMEGLLLLPLVVLNDPEVLLIDVGIAKVAVGILETGGVDNLDVELIC